MLLTPSEVRNSSDTMLKRTAAPLDVRSVTKTYGDFRALDDVTLSIEAGEFIAILGPSGSGKSTLLMAVAGFIRPDAGRILFDGSDIVRAPANRRGFGVVFQNYALFPHMDVLANVGFPLRVRGVAKREISGRAEAALETVKLSGYGSRGISELSGGQRQRVALARAIVFEPKVLLMDEPLSALDKTLREEMQIEIRELHNKLQITTLYVTHDQREALTIADRIAVMDKGRIVQLDTPEVLYRHPADEFVAKFIGEATILDSDRLAGAGAKGKVVIRSEDFCLRPDGDADGWATLEGTLRGIVFQGDSWLLQVELADGTLIGARAQQHFAPDVSALLIGQPLPLHVPRTRLHVLGATNG
ncbi:ABC transporter ATP-binding protein [Mesorhizobium sp. KR9-304]|uniref:ABC transporter ATP-binding protein n=1 Tax=Mesorhizobium sp. KR9-304 TaxID=3156614 RepID=UPI0032B5DB8A